MWNRPTLLRAEQSRAWATAPFLRFAERLKLNTTFVMDNRRIWTGLLYPVRFGGFCALVMRSAKDGMGNRRFKLACNRMFDISDDDAANAASSSEL
jgi:hypothetical protein